MRNYKRILDKEGINEEILQNIIADTQKDRDHMYNLYKRYDADPEGPEIFGRSLVDYQLESDRVQRLDDKVNNRLNNAFDAEIVDTKIGYMFGHPISYGYDKKAKKKKNKDGETVTSNSKIESLIEDFLLRNNSEDADAEFGLVAAVCGKAARLAYVDKDGDFRVKNIDPWQVVFIGDDIHEPNYSLRVYEEDGKQYAEFYDDKDTYFFEEDKGWELTDIKPHLFEFDPLFGVENNRDQKGDAEKVYALINAYDRTLSDASNEIEQYRLAYLILKGIGADEDTMEEFKKGGLIQLLGDNDEVKYLTKDINDTMIENHLNRLEENIMRFAKSVNFSDESFGGNITGVAMKYKLMALENKCITMERKFVSSLRYQFKVLFSAWSKLHGLSKEDYLKVYYSFKRNLPDNLLEEAQVQMQLKGLVSEKTRLGLFSQVDDVQFEIDEMKKEMEEMDEYLALDDPLNDDDSDLDDKKKKAGSESTEKKTCDVCGGDGTVTSNKTGDQIQCKRCGGSGEV